MTEQSGFLVMYRLADEDIPRADGEKFDLRRDAIDHRDWFFGHCSDVVTCWIANTMGKKIGATLRRRVP